MSEGVFHFISFPFSVLGLFWTWRLVKFLDLDGEKNTALRPSRILDSQLHSAG